MAYPNFDGVYERQHFESIESTHIYLGDMVSKTSPRGGFHVTADYQSGGRGQIGRNWQSAARQNLLVSYVFYPDFLPANRSFDLAVWVSESLMALLDSLGIRDTGIKWPNDVYIGDQKVGGILIQNTLRGDRIKNCIVSVGLNVNEVDFPKDIPNPVSLRQVTGQAIDREELLRMLTHILDQNYGLLASPSGVSQFWKRYREKLWGRDRYLYYQLQDECIIQAKVVDVDSDGKLRLLLDSGGERVFVFREVRWMGV